MPRLLALVPLSFILALAPNAVRAQTLQSLQNQITRLDAALRKSDSTVKSLEARLLKMERDAEQDDQDLSEEAEKAEQEEKLASLERRVGSLERSPSGNRGGGSAPAGGRVRAPFVVEDADGSVIMRVTGGKSPRLVVGDDKGGQVELGTGSAGGGVVRVRDATNTDRAFIIASDNFGQFRATSESHSAILMASSADHGATLALFKGDTPSARLRSGVQGYGALVLADPSGDPTMFAGAQQSKGCQVGIVKVGPRGRPGTLGPASLLQGAC
ncbi:MAG: hypothetical protein IT361_06810 [Gemmatimonadaceae bacterium]|nr:hypothetical protein [Gemmatimonadaceae bacterium]